MDIVKANGPEASLELFLKQHKCQEGCNPPTPTPTNSRRTACNANSIKPEETELKKNILSPTKSQMGVNKPQTTPRQLINTNGEVQDGGPSEP